MEQTLKVANVLSDPTRFHIYQYLVENHAKVNVTDIAKEFNIHPNVARLHLSKLEDVKMVISHSEKTGKGGRPSRQYQLSDNVIEFNFPHRDYKLLSSILIQSLSELGDIGKQAIYKTGLYYGKQVLQSYQRGTFPLRTMKEKVTLLEEASSMLGLYSHFEYNEKKQTVSFQVNNCPFKEVVTKNPDLICGMHHAFIKGMFEALFNDVDVLMEENMFTHNCESCLYRAYIASN